MARENPFGGNPFSENVAALFSLYGRPVAAISRILDRGRLWFAIVAALLVSAVAHLPELRMASQIVTETGRPSIAREAPPDEGGRSGAPSDASDEGDRGEGSSTPVAV